MRKVREVLRLKHVLKLAERPIAASLGIGHTTVNDYVRRAEQAGMTWQEAEKLSDAEVEARLFKQVGYNEPNPYAPIDLKWVHMELRRPGVTLELLWCEYQQAVAKCDSVQKPYQYSRFCELYRAHAKRLSPVMRQVHRAGEKAFVDFSGKKPRIHDRETGEATEVELFVMVLGASSYTYAEATRTQQVGDFVGATVNGLEYFEGVPELLVPDQLRSAVSRPDRIEPEIQATFAEMAQHYGTAVVPARPRKPRDKAKVEAAVRLAQRWILGCLRHRRFFSLEELNAAIRELLERLNTKPFQKLEGCRRSAYEKLDRPALKPLPSRRYELSEWKLDVGVNVDYHVEYDHRLYSVSCALLGARVDVRATRQVVELWHGGVRVASHERSSGPKGTAVTKPEHRPQAHREWGNWPPERLVSWASQTGPNTANVVESILGHQTHPETGRRACLGLMRLVEKYGAKRVEAACERAIQIGNPKYKSVAAILKNGLDKTAWKEQEQASPVVHENIRGGAYFDRGETESVDTTKEETEGEIGARDLDEERIAIMNEPRLESTRRERAILPEEGREASTEGASLGAAQVASPRARREPLTELIARLQTLWSSPMRVQKSREELGHKEGREGGPRRPPVNWQQESHRGAVERRAGPRERESAETSCGVEDAFGGRLCYWRGEA